MKMEQTATVQSSELLEALKQVSVTQDPVDPSATLEFTNSFLRLHTSGRGRASATIVIDYQGPRVTIDVYPKLLIDILNVTKNKPLTAEFHTGDDPLFLHAPESSDEPVHRCMIAPRCEASSKPVAQEAASL
jgi:DNA polymerase III sliding clamp (beta) subunit (PCNA family)